MMIAKSMKVKEIYGEVEMKFQRISDYGHYVFKGEKDGESVTILISEKNVQGDPNIPKKLKEFEHIFQGYIRYNDDSVEFFFL